MKMTILILLSLVVSSCRMNENIQFESNTEPESNSFDLSNTYINKTNINMAISNNSSTIIHTVTWNNDFSIIGDIENAVYIVDSIFYGKGLEGTLKLYDIEKYIQISNNDTIRIIIPWSEEEYHMFAKNCPLPSEFYHLSDTFINNWLSKGFVVERETRFYSNQSDPCIETFNIKRIRRIKGRPNKPSMSTTGIPESPVPELPPKSEPGNVGVLNGENEEH